MKIKKKHIFRFFGPFFSSFIIFGWDFVENEKNHQKSTVILLQFWLSKQKNYFWSHAKLAKMSSFQCPVPPPPKTSNNIQCSKYMGLAEAHEKTSRPATPNPWSFGLPTQGPQDQVLHTLHRQTPQLHELGPYSCLLWCRRHRTWDFGNSWGPPPPFAVDNNVWLTNQSGGKPE